MQTKKNPGEALFDKYAVSPEKLYPTESYRDRNPIQKVQAMKGGKDAVESYLSKMYEKGDKDDTEKISQHCQCCSKAANRSTKPRAGGTAITERPYMEELTEYENERLQTIQEK